MFNEKAYIIGLEVTIENLEDQVEQLCQALAEANSQYDKLQAEIRRSSIEGKGE